jgi:ABC-2 type transport system permease protein
MRNIWYVFKKEIIVYFTTPVAYIVMLAFLVISGYLFHFYFSFVRVSDLSRVFNNMIIAGMLVSPILTMRLLSEEKKIKHLRTFENISCFSLPSCYR